MFGRLMIAMFAVYGGGYGLITEVDIKILATSNYLLNLIPFLLVSNFKICLEYIIVVIIRHSLKKTIL